MNTKDRGRKGRRWSLFWMLTAHYAFFMLTLVVLAVGMVLAADAVLNRVVAPPVQDSSAQMVREVKKGDYAAIRAGHWLGDEGWFQVIENGEAVFTSADAPAGADFSPQDVACIPLDSDGGWSVYAETYGEDGQQEGGTVLYHFFPLADAQAEEILLAERATGRVLYADPRAPVRAASLSALQQELLMGVWGDYSVSRSACTLADGGAGMVLMFQPMTLTSRQNRAIDLVYNLLVPAFCLVSAVVLGLFVWWLSRRVKKPLAMLSAGMRQLAECSRGAQLEYRGPAEFEQMCASFNTLSARLYEAERRRADAEADKQTMLADISHDLKTPITVIEGYARAVSDGMVPQDQQPRYLRIICQKAALLDSLIEAFSTYSKLEHPDYHPALARTDLCECVREYLAGKFDEVELAGCELDVEIPDAPVWCLLDVQMWDRVLDNLLANALRHNPPGTRIRISVAPPAPGAGEDGPMASVLLEDSGAGIAPEVAPHIFEPFAMGDASRASRGGSGLGLSIAKKIVEAHGGAIALLAPDGIWKTRFSMRLPTAP